MFVIKSAGLVADDLSVFKIQEMVFPDKLLLETVVPDSIDSKTPKDCANAEVIISELELMLEANVITICWAEDTPKVVPNVVVFE